MTNKEQLNKEELNKISGGVDEYLKYIHRYTNKLNKYDTVNYINQNLYFVKPDSNAYVWVYGTLLDSYERSWGCGKTIRTAKVSIIESGRYASNQIVDLDLDIWKAYSK